MVSGAGLLPDDASTLRRAMVTEKNLRADLQPESPERGGRMGWRRWGGGWDGVMMGRRDGVGGVGGGGGLGGGVWARRPSAPWQIMGKSGNIIETHRNDGKAKKLPNLIKNDQSNET